ncbi:hypothetical protein ACFUJU_18895 [Streptomyces sp. NPDC057235]|uniref:hypothetical protein n=1 Tax=Streptomyces sp. NPDC057235 TaxID=3346058 RepID=UPI00362C479B
MDVPGAGEGAAGESAGDEAPADDSEDTEEEGEEGEEDDAGEAKEPEDPEEDEDAEDAEEDGTGPVPPAPPTTSDASSTGPAALALSCEACDSSLGSPALSAASCNHSGGVSRNDVWFRSIRAAGTAAWGGTSSADPYSSSYRRITSPTGSPGHSVASPLSRAITSRWRPPSDVGPPSRSSAHTTNPSSNSRTRTSRCW